MINDHHRPLAEQNERGAVLYLSNTSLPQTRLDGYLIYRHDDKVLSNGNQGHLWAFGARAEGDFADRWKYRAEFAEELGRENGRGVAGFGFNSRLSCFLKDSWNHNFRLGYEYLSGDDPGTGRNEGWDPLWGRRGGQFSELQVYPFSVEGRGRNSDWTNLQRLDLGWSCNPTKRMELLADYMPLFANTNPLRDLPGSSWDGRVRGHLFAAILKYTFSEHVTGHLWSEFFLPGDYYSADRRDMAVFLRAELILKF